MHIIFLLKKIVYRWTPFKKEKRWAQEPKTNEEKKLYEKKIERTEEVIEEKKKVLLVEEKIEEVHVW